MRMFGGHCLCYFMCIDNYCLLRLDASLLQSNMYSVLLLITHVYLLHIVCSVVNTCVCCCLFCFVLFVSSIALLLLLLLDLLCFFFFSSPFVVVLTSCLWRAVSLTLDGDNAFYRNHLLILFI